MEGFICTTEINLANKLISNNHYHVSVDKKSRGDIVKKKYLDQDILSRDWDILSLYVYNNNNKTLL